MNYLSYPIKCNNMLPRLCHYTGELNDLFNEISKIEVTPQGKESLAKQLNCPPWALGPSMCSFLATLEISFVGHLGHQPVLFMMQYPIISHYIMLVGWLLAVRPQKFCTQMLTPRKKAYAVVNDSIRSAYLSHAALYHAMS